MKKREQMTTPGADIQRPNLDPHLKAIHMDETFSKRSRFFYIFCPHGRATPGAEKAGDQKI